MVGRAINNPSNALPPFWMIKLTEVWGEPKNDSKGEDDGLKIEQGEGTRRKKQHLFPDSLLLLCSAGCLSGKLTSDSVVRISFLGQPRLIRRV